MQNFFSPLVRMTLASASRAASRTTPPNSSAISSSCSSSFPNGWWPSATVARNMSADARCSRVMGGTGGVGGTDRGGGGRAGRFCRDFLRASCSWASLLCMGARAGMEGGGSRDGERDLRSKEDFALRGDGEDVSESDSPGLGDDGDEPTDELSVTDVPRDRGDEDVSESLSELRDEAEETEETFRIFCAVATSSALMVWTFVVERKTGDEILKLETDLDGLMSLVGMAGSS